MIRRQIATTSFGTHVRAPSCWCRPLLLPMVTTSVVHSSRGAMSLDQLRNVALGVLPPNGAWLRMSDVARQLPDDFFESLPDEVQGLRGLLETCDPNTVAQISFRSGAGGKLEVSRARPKQLHGRRPSTMAASSSSRCDETTAGVGDGGGVSSPSSSSAQQGGNLSSGPSSLPSFGVPPPPPPPPVSTSESLSAEGAPPLDPALLKLAEKFEAGQIRKQQAPTRIPTPPEEVKKLARSQLEEEQRRMRALASFPVPIIAAAQEHFGAVVASPTTSAVSSSSVVTDRRGNKMSIQELVAKYLLGVLQDVSYMVDLFCCKYTDPWSAIARVQKKEAGSSGQRNLTQTDILRLFLAGDAATASAMIHAAAAAADHGDFFTHLCSSGVFVRVLPPFVPTHLNATMDSVHYAHKVPEYDAYRLARFLSTEHFVSLPSLGRSDVQGILSKPVAHIVAAFPNHFEFAAANDDDGTTTSPAAQQQLLLSSPSSSPPPSSCFSVDDIIEESRRNDLPPVGVVSRRGDDESGHDVIRSERDCAGGKVRYILAPQDFNAATKCSPAFQDATLPQLQKATSLLSKPHNVVQQQIAAGTEVLGVLPSLPYGPKRLSVKMELVRAMTAKRFPYGNVFLDRNVLAHFIFDTIPADEAVSFEDYRTNFLGKAARNVAPTSGNFLHSFPHLFNVFQDPTNHLWFIQRADSKHLVTMPTVEDIAERDVVRAMVDAMPKKLDPEKPLSLTAITFKLPRVIIKAARRFGGFQGIIDCNPKEFYVLDEVGHFFYQSELTPEIRAKLGLDAVESATQKERRRALHKR